MKLTSTMIAAVAAAAMVASAQTNVVGQRKENQQDRVAQGIKSGQLTAGETAKLENREQGINREVSADKQANGGKLTGADRKAINQSQSRTSRNIYRDKHNNAHTGR